ncbi:MAG: dTDP-4-dehydrorhamnose reductase [Phycisphaerae bacterium]
MPLDRPILVLGSQGMLGRAWCELLRQRGEAFEAHDLDTLDVTRKQDLARIIAMRPAAVINCVAYTDVDGAESDESAAELLNTRVPGDLAAISREIDTLFVHYSTDYVFGGTNRTPRLPDSMKDPLSVYGRTKLEGERVVTASGARSLIIRTSWLYAPWGKNFVLTIANLARKGDRLRVVNDQRGRPTSAEHLAATSHRLVSRGEEGLYHITDGDACTWYEFAEAIVELTGADCSVEPCTSEEFPRPAPRPSYSVLDLSEVETLLGTMPHWRKNLSAVIEQVYGRVGQREVS